MNAKYEAIASKGIGEAERFYAAFYNALSPEKAKALAKHIEAKKRENLAAHFASLPEVHMPAGRARYASVMSKQDFMLLSLDDMAEYCEAYLEAYNALDQGFSTPRDLSELLKQKDLFDGDKVDLSSAAKARKLVALYQAAPKFKDPVSRLPAYPSPFALFDRNVSYDVNDVKESGKYPASYVYEREALQTKEDEIKAKLRAAALKKTAMQKLMRYVLWGLLPSLIVMVFAIGLASLFGFALFQIPGWTEGTYRDAGVPFGAAALFLILCFGLRLLFEAIPTDFFRNPAPYEYVKGLGLLTSGIARLAISFVVPLFFFRDAAFYWQAFAHFAVFSAIGFASQLFFQPRERTYAPNLFLEVLGETFLAAYGPFYLMVDDGSGNFVRNPWMFFLYFAVALGIFGYAYLQYQDLPGKPTGRGIALYLRKVLLNAVLPLLFFGLAMGMMTWMKSFFYQTHETYMGLRGADFGWWWTLTWQVFTTIALGAVVTILLAVLDEYANLSHILDVEDRVQHPTVGYRIFWSVVSAYIMFAVAFTGFSGWLEQAADREAIVLCVIGALPYLFLPIMLSIGRPRIMPGSSPKLWPMFYAPFVAAVAFPCVAMTLLSCHGALGLGIYTVIFEYAGCYAIYLLNYVSQSILLNF